MKALFIVLMGILLGATPALAGYDRYTHGGASTQLWTKSFFSPYGVAPVLFGTSMQTQSIAPFYLGGGGFWGSEPGGVGMGYGGVIVGSSYVIGGNTTYDLRILAGGGSVLGANPGFVFEPSLGYGLVFGQNVLSLNAGYLYATQASYLSGWTLGLRLDFFKFPFKI